MSVRRGINPVTLWNWERVQLVETAAIRGPGPPADLVEKEPPGMEKRQSFPWGRENQENAVTKAREECFKEGMLKKKIVWWAKSTAIDRENKMRIENWPIAKLARYTLLVTLIRINLMDESQDEAGQVGKEWWGSGDNFSHEFCWDERKNKEVSEEYYVLFFVVFFKWACQWKIAFVCVCVKEREKKRLTMQERCANTNLPNIKVFRKHIYI